MNVNGFWEDPDERTRVSHDDESHLLPISRQAATSVMARELALHEFAHMARYEQGHPSHTQPTEEAIYLALAGQSVERRKLSHCLQIANHMKDIYADDIWLEVAPADKLVTVLESELAAAVADVPYDPPAGQRLTPSADPDITAVNAAFALALVERHDLVDDDHPIYDLAHVAADDAPYVGLSTFKRHFASLARETDESTYRKPLVDVTREYATAQRGEQAAD